MRSTNLWALVAMLAASAASAASTPGDFRATVLAGSIVTSTTTQDAEGRTDKDITPEQVKEWTKYVLQQSLPVGKRSCLQHGGDAATCSNLKGDDSYRITDIGEYRIALIDVRISAGAIVVRGLRIMTIKGGNLISVGCVRLGDEPLTPTAPPCSDEIKRSLGISLAMATSAAGAPSEGFYAWGFRANMTVPQATALAQQFGYPFVVGDGTPIPRSVGFYASHADADIGIGYVAEFCVMRLHSITQFKRGTIGSFVDTWQKLQSIYGAPTVNTSSTALPDGQYRWIKVSFPTTPGDAAVLIARTNPGSDSAFRISVTHDTGGACSRPE